MAKINIEEAKKRLQKPQSFSAAKTFKAEKPKDIEFIDVVNDNMFLFKVDETYVLSPADDQLPAIIGEFDEMPEDYSMPPCLTDWLDEYSQEIDYFQENESIILGAMIEEETYGANNITLVDLGLSVKWANMNLGSINPEDPGNYYAWGEVDTKTTYKWSTYKYGDGTTVQDLGNISKSKTYDAAFAQNNTLCIPTKEQFDELINKCSWVKTTKNNLNVWQVTGPNGNVIYIPINGCISDSSSVSYKDYAYCWTSTQSTSVLKAEVFKTTTKGTFYSMAKRTGAAIRPVSANVNENPLALVDLGLSVNWANMNIGAEKPEDSGDYYSWAELEPKDDYTWDTYKYYVHVPEQYKNIGSNIAKTEYDQAYALNKNLCLPTKEQWEELISKCSFTETTKNNVKGYEVKGPNGNKIFLPFAGDSYDGKTYNANVNGYYHTANVGPTDQQFTCAKVGEKNVKTIYELRKRTGSSIRPVGTSKTLTNNLTDIQLVDLGLSVYWADRNLGAKSVDAVGDFYAWGDSEPNKKNFNWTNYKYYIAERDESKDLGSTFSKNSLYDVANLKNNNMCIPESSHWEELISKCTFTETTKNNVKGFDVKGPNGNSIFLPIAGYKTNSTVKYYNEKSYYTAASYYSSNVYQSSRALNLAVDSKPTISTAKKYVGLTIRPISVKENNIKKYIEPLMPFKWSQTAPFNDELPLDPSTNKRVVTGCTQTAFAQMLAYLGLIGFNGRLYRRGMTKTPAYTSSYKGKPTIKIPALDPIVQFDYDNMNFKKPADFKTAESKKAVATLMKYLGYADKAKYASTGTASNQTSVLDTARNKVHIIDNKGKIIYASSGLQKFKDSIYNELQMKLPVQVSGHGSGGHAFICDGYNPNTDKFHFNWGWGGSYDGWFDMALLTPGTCDFNSSKSAIVEFYPEHIGGDINGDSEVNIVDVTELVNAILRNNTYDYKYDLNNDGEITQTDIQILVEVILGKRIL